MTSPSPATDRLLAFTRMRSIATGLLLFMALLFVLTHTIFTEFPGVSWVRVFSEAALVGACADWFAVVALFRHPLNLPFPHTAIIPRNQGRIGRELASFMRENFLSPELMTARIERLSPAAALARWLAEPEHARRVAQWVGDLVRGLIDSVDEAAFRAFVGRELRGAAQSGTISTFLGKVLGGLSHSGTSREILGSGMGAVRDYLGSNRDAIREWMSQELPWYIPEPVHRHVFERFFESFLTTLADVSQNRAHPLRAKLQQDLEGLVIDLQSGGPRAIALNGWLVGLLDTNSGGAASRIWESSVRDFLRAQAGETERLEGILQGAAEKLLADADLQALLNRSILRASRYTLTMAADEFGRIIEETMAGWDARTVAEKIEIQVGRDLQFIRLNGTLVGGAVGVGLHAIVRLLS